MQNNVKKVLLVGNGFDLNIEINEFELNNLNDLIFLKNKNKKNQIISFLKTQ